MQFILTLLKLPFVLMFYGAIALIIMMIVGWGYILINLYQLIMNM